MTPHDPSPDEAADRVVALMDLGRKAEALAEVETALATFPDDDVLHSLRADLLIDLGRFHEAVAAAEYAISLGGAMGVAHTTHAEALIARGQAGRRRDRDPAGAIASAEEGVRLNPSPSSYYTLVRALLERRDRRRAERVAQILRAEWPTSALAPLAFALVHLSRAGVLRREWRVNGWRFLVVAIVTQGGVLVPALIFWAVRSLWRAPHLRGADRYLHEALALEPTNPGLRALTADVLRMRFRFPRAVDYEVTAGALEAGLVEADELVAGVSRRLTIAILVAFFTWAITVSLLDEVLARTTTAAIGMAAVVAAVAGVVLFRNVQARMLPRRLRRRLDVRLPPLLAAAFSTASLAVAGSASGSGAEGPQGYWLASLLGLPVVAPATLWLAVAFVMGRRS